MDFTLKQKRMSVLSVAEKFLNPAKCINIMYFKGILRVLQRYPQLSAKFIQHYRCAYFEHNVKSDHVGNHYDLPSLHEQLLELALLEN